MNLDQVDIKRLIPHRHSMAMVDAVTVIEYGKRIVARKAITVTETCYLDIPDDTKTGDYAYPKSLIMESFCQAGGIMYAHQQQAEEGLLEGVMLFVSMGGIEFLDDAYPGEVLEHHVCITKSLTDAVVFEGKIRVHDRKIARIDQMLAAIRPTEVVHPTGK